MLISLCRHRRMSTNRGCQATGSGRYPAPGGHDRDPVEVMALRLPPQEGVVEILVIIVIAVLILGVAVGPLLAMRNPAEADKLAPGPTRAEPMPAPGRAAPAGLGFSGVDRAGQGRPDGACRTRPT